MDDSLKTTEIMNIQQTVQRAREEGIPLSSYTLRRAIRSKELPCRVVGKTYLILWSNVLKWLKCDEEFAHLPKE